MTQHDQYYGHLVGSLQLLAADAEHQLAFLPDFVVATDEVAGDFLDMFHLLSELEEVGMVERSAGDVIRQVKKLLDSEPTIPPGPVKYYAARLKNDDFWACARVAAKEALLALNEEVVLPELWWKQRKARGQR